MSLRCPECSWVEVESTTKGQLAPLRFDYTNTSTCLQCGLKTVTAAFELAAHLHILESVLAARREARNGGFGFQLARDKHGRLIAKPEAG
jgi:hypothetical protein